MQAVALQLLLLDGAQEECDWKPLAFIIQMKALDNFHLMFTVCSTQIGACCGTHTAAQQEH